MSTLDKILVPSKFLENVTTTQYTCSTLFTIIDKCSISNNSSSTVLVNIYLVNSGGSASASNLFVSGVSILPNKSYDCPEITGQKLRNGDFIATLAGSPSALACRIVGREIS